MWTYSKVYISRCMFTNHQILKYFLSNGYYKINKKLCAKITRGCDSNRIWNIYYVIKLQEYASEPTPPLRQENLIMHWTPPPSLGTIFWICAWTLCGIKRYKTTCKMFLVVSSRSGMKVTFVEIKISHNLKTPGFFNCSCIWYWKRNINLWVHI